MSKPPGARIIGKLTLLTFIIYSRSHATAMKDVLMRPPVPVKTKMTNKTNMAIFHSNSKMAAYTCLGLAYDHAQIGHTALSMRS